MERYERYSRVLTFELLWPATHKHAHYIDTHKKDYLSIHTQKHTLYLSHTLYPSVDRHTHTLYLFILNIER